MNHDIFIFLLKWLALNLRGEDIYRMLILSLIMSGHQITELESISRGL